jgi:hypothetical protein
VQGRKLMIIGTTSQPQLLDQMQFRDAFNVVLNVPRVKPGDEIRIVFETMQVPIAADQLELIVSRVTHEVGIKQLLMVCICVRRDRGSERVSQ